MHLCIVIKTIEVTAFFEILTQKQTSEKLASSFSDLKLIGATKLVKNEKAPKFEAKIQKIN